MIRPDRATDVPPDEFDRRWQERFTEFASMREDDAGIAGWSASGLDTRLRFFRRIFSPPAPGAVYIDVGCGAATYTRWLTEQGIFAVGVDYSLPSLNKARARTPAAIPLCGGNALSLPFRDGAFDGAICFGLLQAMSGSSAVVRELARILRPGGRLWIDALNHQGLSAGADRARRRLRKRPMHLRYERPRRLVEILESCGFGAVTLHWLPIVPARVLGLQPLFETRLVRALLAGVSPLGALLSHAFILAATRR